MFEGFDDEARAVVVQAQIHARRLGHRYLGCEHLLLALTSSGTDLSRVLGASGLTPASVEAATLRVLGTPGPPDQEALAAIGIDLDQVRATVEASFGPGALRVTPSPGHRRRWGRSRRCRATGHTPFTARAKHCLELAVRETQALGGQQIGVDHLALALTTMTGGLAPEILAVIGITPMQLRAAILDRYPRAS